MIFLGLNSFVLLICDCNMKETDVQREECNISSVLSKAMKYRFEQFVGDGILKSAKLQMMDYIFQISGVYSKNVNSELQTQLCLTKHEAKSNTPSE